MSQDQVSALQKEISRLRAKNRDLKNQLDKCSESQYAQIIANIEKFPSLLTDFPQTLTNHQKEAVKIASGVLKWHPEYVAEFCASGRPCLYNNKYSDPHWEEKAINYQKEHDLSVIELADFYVDYFNKKCAYRVYEPVEFVDGFRIMAQDLGSICPAAKWDNTSERQKLF